MANRITVQAALVGMFLIALRGADGAQPVQAPPADRVVSSLTSLDVWLGEGANADRWHKYLRTEALNDQLAKGAEADPGIVAGVLRRYDSQANGLELRPFRVTREAIARWLAALKGQYRDDPQRRAWAARGDHEPVTPKEFAAIQAELRAKAGALEKFLGGDSPRAQAWKQYLKWNQLEPHLAADAQPSRREVLQLDEVLMRFRANEPGLELPQFVALADAIAHYRVIAGWAAAARARDSSEDYEKLLSSIGAQLERHMQTPTTETSWKIGRLLGVVDNLGESPDYVGEVRSRFAQKNILASVSSRFVLQMPDRNLDQVRPVRDCILGTSIFGTARTLGSLQYELRPSANDARLALHLVGEADSTTRGYNGPVRINTRGRTVFSASKEVTLSEAAFVATPATASVDTRTRITSIQKTGGKFGRRIVEKIAWKRAGEQKRQSELISAQHTRDRILREFNETAARDLAEIRQRYEEKIGAPLIRRGMKPDDLRLFSSPDEVGIQATFANRHQLGANSLPPSPMAGHDITVQVHESAVNNYLPLALASARIAQEAADQQPELSGNMPTWFKLTSIVRPKLAAAASAGLEMVEEAQDRIEDVIEGEDQEKPTATAPPFKPYSITLNADAPVGIRFDDGRVAIRVRAAALESEGSEYTNWDFIVTYEIIAQGDRILLRRIGDIEVFPTGFDPAWDKQLTAQQSGFRSTLAKNMNARAKSGQSFPDEIPIEPVRFSRFGVMVLRELVADDGWLTLGWQLPEAAGPPRTAPTPPRAG